MTTTGSTTIYIASLGPRLAAMYQRLRGPLAQALSGKMECNFPLSEALLILFRSLAYQFKPQWLDWLARLDENGSLSVGLTQEDEHAIRQLRNRGLIDHDGPWLFSYYPRTGCNPRKIQDLRAFSGKPSPSQYVH